MAASEELQTAKRVKAGAASWLTRAVKSCDVLLARDLSQVDVTEYESVIQNYAKRLDTWDTAQGAVETLVAEAELDAFINEAADYREKAELSRIALVSAWSRAHPVVQEGSAGSVCQPSVKLPKLELPKFGGEVVKFTPFWQQFVNAVDSQESLPEVSKFNYLVGLLKGDAKAVLDGLPITEENYETAKQILTRRYGRKELVCFVHIQELLGLEVPDVKQTTELCHFCDKLQGHVRALAALDIKSDNFGVILTPIIVSRMPEELRLEWSRDSEGKEADLDHLMSFLEVEIKRRERCRSFGSLVSSQSRHEVSSERQGKPRSTAAALQSSEAVCAFCNKRNHTNERCFQFKKLSVQERIDKVKRSNLCFRCLTGGHRARFCKKSCSKCKGNHHALICLRGAESSQSAESAGASDGAEEEKQASVSAALTVNRASVSALPVATVSVRGSGGACKATLLFDSGSDKSYVSRELVQKVRPRWVKNVKTSFASFGGRSHESRSKVFELSLSGGGQDVACEFTEVPVICLPLSRPEVPSDVLECFDHLDLAFDFSGQAQESLKIDILVGQDLFWKLMLDKVFKVEGSPVAAQQSLFGWVLSGGSSASGGVALLNVSELPDTVVKSFWELEALGIKDQDYPADPAIEQFEDNIEFDEEAGRYTVGLLWKRESERPTLPENREVAFSSLKRLQKRLARDPELRRGYEDAVGEMISNGFCEFVNEDEVPAGPVHYLPHHPHVKESSTSTKIRPVFNASCRGANGVSLNDCLESGPNLNPNVCDVLMRFRRWKFAVTADVRKAFLQVQLQKSDQDVHRFLWPEGEAVRALRFVRVTFGIKCSMFLLLATIQHHLALFPPSAVIDELKSSLYVDDFLSGADTEAGVKHLYEEANRVMNMAGMTLAKWSSNSSSVLGASLESSDASSPYVKVLGISWDSEKDLFVFVGTSLSCPVRCTKRVVLSLLARVFDPLGYVLPVTMCARILFQDVWRLGQGWDAELPEEICSTFEKWLRDLVRLREVTIPRQYFSVPWSEAVDSVELHVFGDASLRGYGACVYLCYRAGSECQCVLVRSCARVAPLKRKTLPRLELLACLVTAQLLKSVVKGLCLSPETRYTCWTDSMVALGWVRGIPSRWKPWVANRVCAIQELTDPAKWRHIAGRENPADLVSRGVSAERLVQEDLWWHGPAFLRDVEEAEDVVPEDVPVSEEVEAERKVQKASLVCPCLPPVFDASRWSSVTKAFRVVAWCLRFISNARSGGRRECSQDLTADEVSEARLVFLKSLQKDHFAAEISSLGKGECLPKGSKLRRLDPFLDDDGLLRVRGRVQLSELAHDSKHPVILPKCHGSLLFVRFAHHFLSHGGVGAMVSYVRKDFEIFGLRNMAKAVKRSCVPCQRLDARPIGERVAPLPKERVTRAPVFSVTGIDFAGPMYCVDCPGKKFYICLFVCGVVRALHLELVESLSAEDFVFAFRRFAAVRSLPSVVYSDNGTNLVRGHKILSKHMGPLAPKWRFNCPLAPWWGGWWERLVRSVKSCLRKMLGRDCLTRVELSTCLCEVAAAVNSRPLTFVGTDIESSLPLTPNHFLDGQGGQGLCHEMVEDAENVGFESLSLRHQEMVLRLEDFWRVWSDEYVRGLPPAFEKFRKSGNLQVGSVVVVREDGVPRMKWSLGVVEELHVGRDGVPRAATLKTASGRKTRAVQKLYNMEVCGDVSETDVAEEAEVEVCNDVSEEVEVVTEKCEKVKGRERKLPSKFRDYVMD